MVKINYNQDRVDMLNQKLNKLSAFFSDMSTKMEPFAKSSIIGEGASIIAGNISTLETRADGNSRVIRNGQNLLSDSEILNEQLIDSIEIPSDLNNVYSPTNINTENVSVDKKDGRSVTEGEAVLEQSLELDKNIEKERLENILENKKEQEEKELTEFKDVKDLGLEEVGTEFETEEKELDNIGEEIEKENLEQVNDNSYVKEQDINEVFNYSNSHDNENDDDNMEELSTDNNKLSDEWSDN